MEEVMKLTTSDLSFYLLSYGYIGTTRDPYLVFLQALGNNQAVRGLKYILAHRQSQTFRLYTLNDYGREGHLARGKWRVEINPVLIQGVNMNLLTAYLPFGVWGPDNDQRYFLVVPGKPGPQRPHHNDLLRRWAEEFTPYPIPPSLNMSAVLVRARLMAGFDLFEFYQAPVLVGPGKSVSDTTPWVVAIKPESFEEVLKEVFHEA